VFQNLVQAVIAFNNLLICWVFFLQVLTDLIGFSAPQSHVSKNIPFIKFL